MRSFAHVLSFVIVAVLGWIGGSLYPAPSVLIAQVSPQVLAARVRGDFQGLSRTQGMSWSALQSLLGQNEAKRLAADAMRLAMQTGSAIKVEHVVDEATKEAEQQIAVPAVSIPDLAQTASVAPATQNLAAPPTKSTSTPAAAPATTNASAPSLHPATLSPITDASAHPVLAARATPAVTVANGAARPRGPFEAEVSLCPGMTISDAPQADSSRHIANFTSVVSVNGDLLAIDPIQDACLSSGFGSRNGRLHKGIDFYNPAGGPILAAGDGKILEMEYRDDYGNTILIDHGRGVYTRYAHLSSFHSGLSVGAQVHAGEEIGLMGNTAGYPVPLHLHYEMLLGDYRNPKGSFGLTPHSPFEYRAAL